MKVVAKSKMEEMLGMVLQHLREFRSLIIFSLNVGFI
jgi:hypothetical protein